MDYLKDQLTAPHKEKLQRSLTDKLPAIQAIFDAVDQNMVEENESASLDEWLWQLRTATEKADDAIDELEFYRLEKARRKKLSTLSDFLKLHIGDRISKRIGSSLQRLKVSIEDLDSGVGSFVHIVNRMNSSSHDHHHSEVLSRETGRMLTINKVLGRGTEQEQLIRWLTSSLSEDEDVVAITIVGIAGVGKTTLAQSVCLDGRVMKHFGHNIVWIHVSSHFDPVMLTKKIIESITKKKPTAETLDVLQSSVEKVLLCERFLVVLDDTWEDSQDGHKWQQFFTPLCKACSGSRILITTRMNSVVYPIERMMKGQERKFLKLDIAGLRSTEMLELFKSCAFSGSDIDGHKELQLIGEQIVKNV